MVIIGFKKRIWSWLGAAQVRSEDTWVKNKVRLFADSPSTVCPIHFPIALDECTLNKTMEHARSCPRVTRCTFLFCWAWENPVMIFEITLLIHCELEIILNLHELEIFLIFPWAWNHHVELLLIDLTRYTCGLCRVLLTWLAFAFRDIGYALPLWQRAARTWRCQWTLGITDTSGCNN
jgi:hypothetical protein